MRKVLVALALLLFAPLAVQAAPIQVNDLAVVSYGSPQQGSGGEFRLSPAAGSPNLFTPFDTFCVQTTEFVNPNGTTIYRVAGISTSTAGNSSKALDPRAAWLFEQFSLGTLGTHGLAYSTNVHAGLLQHAIWHFMGESAYDAANPFITYFGSQTPVGIGNVRVLNLVNARDGSPAQDQLVYVDPVPEAGSLWLVLTGLAGIAVRLRRRQ